MDNKRLPGQGVGFPDDVISAWPDGRVDQAIDAAIERGEWQGPRPTPLELFVPVDVLRGQLLETISAMSENQPPEASTDFQGIAMAGMLITQAKTMLAWLESYPDEYVFMAWFMSHVTEVRITKDDTPGEPWKDEDGDVPVE